MKLFAIVALFVCTSAHAWGVAGLQYMVQPQVQQQPVQQPTYSQQYNAGYMASYLNRNGYAAPDAQYDSAYREGYQGEQNANR
jgi:hypothetical protein